MTNFRNYFGLDDDDLIQSGSASPETIKAVIERVRLMDKVLKTRVKCDCHLYDHQVCDICQKITGDEKDVMPTSPASVTTSAALPNTTAVNYGGKVKKTKKKTAKKK